MLGSHVFVVAIPWYSMLGNESFSMGTSKCSAPQDAPSGSCFQRLGMVRDMATTCVLRAKRLDSSIPGDPGFLWEK